MRGGERLFGGLGDSALGLGEDGAELGSAVLDGVGGGERGVG